MCVFVHDDIQIANQFGFEIPVAILFHYLTGIVLVGIFLWLRNNIKNFPDSIFMGLVYGWVTLLLPWLIMFPALGFGFFGLGADNDMSNVAASFLAHSFYGLGMTLWLGWAGKFITRILRQNLMIGKELRPHRICCQGARPGRVSPNTQIEESGT